MLSIIKGAFSIEIMSSALRARTGRHRQRYDDHLRLVAGCIPYKLKHYVEDDTEDFVSRLEVLMISSPNQNDLVFPKGGWENDETMEEAACREALEEAGVRGVIEKGLGDWKFRSKSRQNSCSTEGTCKGYMFALKVTEELDNWPEKSSHERRWVSVHDAWSLCRYDWMREALAAFISVLPRDQLALPSSELSERQIGALPRHLRLKERSTPAADPCSHSLSPLFALSSPPCQS